MPRGCTQLLRLRAQGALCKVLFFEDQGSPLQLCLGGFEWRIEHSEPTKQEKARVCRLLRSQCPPYITSEAAKVGRLKLSYSELACRCHTGNARMSGQDCRLR